MLTEGNRYAGDVEAVLGVCNHILLTGLPGEQQHEYSEKFAKGLTTKVRNGHH